MPRRTHEDALETRKSILAAAQRLFGRRGYERTSLSDIAKYANVTRGAIYWHFSDKADILMQLCIEIDRDKFLSQNLLDAAKPTEEDPLGRFRDWVLVHGSDDGVQLITSAIFNMIDKIFAGESGDDALREKLHELHVRRHNEVRNVLKNAVAKNQLPDDIDIDLAADSFGVFIVGYLRLLQCGMGQRVVDNFTFMIDLLIETLPKIKKHN